VSSTVEYERCESCGFDGARFDNAALLGALRALGPRWRRLLASTGTELRLRPEPKVWSAIEYAAHSRDITALHAFGVEQALTLDEPAFPAIADDLVESAAAAYREADPDDVVDELDTQAAHLAQLADDAGSDAWSRGLTIDGDRSDVRRLLEHALHDSQHHLDDVERGLARLRERPRD
jgi:DinB superfamily